MVVVIQTLLRINKPRSIQNTLHLWQSSAKAADRLQALLLLPPLALLVLFHPKAGCPLGDFRKIGSPVCYLPPFFPMCVTKPWDRRWWFPCTPRFPSPGLPTSRSRCCCLRRPTSLPRLRRLPDWRRGWIWKSGRRRC